MSDRSNRIVGYYAVGAALAAALISPLLALAYFGTPDGAGSLDQGTVAAWADPTRAHLGGLLTWASPDRVYATYGQALGLLFPAVLLCARSVRATRPAAQGRLERWGWRTALLGYAIAALSLAIVSLMEIALNPNSDAVNGVFLAGMLPGMLLSVVGSNMLGIALVRARYVPRATAWLLALSIPLMIAGSGVLGHNSLGVIPLFAAWAVSGWRLAHAPHKRAGELVAAGA
jgi:hypothetical protein